MSEETDIALMAELEGKITQRIREQIRMMADGCENQIGSVHPSICGPTTTYSTLLHNFRTQLLNDPSFITELTKRIGQKLSHIY